MYLLVIASDSGYLCKFCRKRAHQNCDLGHALPKQKLSVLSARNALENMLARTPGILCNMHCVIELPNSCLMSAEQGAM